METINSAVFSLIVSARNKCDRPYEIIGHISSFFIPSIYLFCAGSLFFDLVHYQLHRCTRSSHPLLRRLARAHHYHHLYYNYKMEFDDKYLQQNLFQALPLELGMQILGSCLGYILARSILPDAEKWITQSHLWYLTAVQVLKTGYVMSESGRDSNHITYKTAPKDPNWMFVGPEFHALHHVYPDRYFGSFVKWFDWVFGTACSFRGKHVVLTGANGAFGQAILKELQCEGVRSIRTLDFGSDWKNHDLERVKSVFSESDILILAHGSKDRSSVESNTESSVELVRLFKQHSKANKTASQLPEVWYIGSEMEMQPSLGNSELQRIFASERKFLPHARSFFDDPDMLYRHVVPSSFESSTGHGIISATLGAKVTMWWIRRGARYVPVTYTGIAFLNYPKFMWWTPYAESQK